MALSTPIQPITESDAFIRAALEEAYVPPLLPTVAHLTGDVSLLRPELRPDPARVRLPEGGLSDEQKARSREIALEALIRYRDAGCPPAPDPSPEDLRRFLEFSVGGSMMEEYLPLVREELGITGDLRAPNWRKDTLAPETPFVVAIVGAGMSGILAAYRLRQAGVDVVILEKNSDVGGTWFENTYPGCRVDVPNHFYSYSFAQKDDWPQHFSSQQVLLDYFRACVDEFGLRQHIRFNTEVDTATFDEERLGWSIRLHTPEGEEVLEVQAMISAVGQLNRPSLPSIAGIESFAGPSFHSAQWDWDVDLTGKKVAVIGTGCSAAQFVPIIAADVAELAVFQRTANWIVPTPDYHDEVGDGLRWLFLHVPFYAEWYRFWLFWQGAEGMLPAARVDPSWQPQDRSVSAANDEVRELLTAALEVQFAEAPDLRDKVVPTYPPAAKRIIRDNGLWAQTLKADHVELITEKIEAITPTGVATADGEEFAADVIIYATGFTASRFLTPMKVVGRGGVDLHEQWDGNARAFLGITVPNFPNFFCLYGPNTNIVVNGSIIWFSECEVNYILGCVRLLLEGGQAMDCKVAVHDAYNRRIDEGNLQMVWGVSTVSSWYKNAKGRVAQNWPFTLLEFWQQTRRPDPADYEFLIRGARNAA